MLTYKVSSRTLVSLEIGDILDGHGQHPGRVVAIDYFASTVTVETIGWLGRLWLRLTGAM